MVHTPLTISSSTKSPHLSLVVNHNTHASHTHINTPQTYHTQSTSLTKPTSLFTHQHNSQYSHTANYSQWQSQRILEGSLRRIYAQTNIFKLSTLRNLLSSTGSEGSLILQQNITLSTPSEEERPPLTHTHHPLTSYTVL